MSVSHWFQTIPEFAQRFWPPGPSIAKEPYRPVLVIIEGRYDIEFLKRIGKLLAIHNPDSPNLAELELAGKLVFIPSGGDFDRWSTRLAAFGCPEVHLYDREIAPLTEQRLAAAIAVNRRRGCRAFVTRHRALENYLHPDAIREACRLDLAFSDQDDVAALAAQAKLATHSEIAWDVLSRRARQRLRNRAKAWLNTIAVDHMTLQRLAERDPAGEISQWLTAIGQFAIERGERPMGL